MILLLVPLACAGIALVRGRTFTPLAEIKFRAVWAAAASLGIQVGILGVAPGGSRPLHAALHVVSYLLAGWFVVSNRHIPGLPLVALGGALNLLVISLNHGVMPASPGAMAAAGVHSTGGFENSAVVGHPTLAFLGDVIPVPGPWAIRTVLSAGDLILLAGAVWLVMRCSRPAPETGASPTLTA